MLLMNLGWSCQDRGVMGGVSVGRLCSIVILSYHQPVRSPIHDNIMLIYLIIYFNLRFIAGE